MKNVGIITLCDYDNFGNRLQNYALKKYLERLNVQAHNIWIDYPSDINIIIRTIKIIINKLKKPKNKFYKLKRKKAKEFSKKYISTDYSIRLSNNLKKIDKKYDYFIVGSDQVWNYKYINDYKLYFMERINKKKCLSYAASFGLSNIPDEYIEKYKKGLNHLNYISVREERGKEIVKEITGNKNATVLLDPTMLLGESDWKEIAEKPKLKLPERYILTYFLGQINNNREKQIIELSKKNKCDVINIMDINNPFYGSSPTEFLYLINNSKMICTDSFHACVFSIIFDKNFIAFDRIYNGKNINSRINTLLSKLKINGKKYNEKEITKDNLYHNYSKTYEILRKETKKSREFLEKALEIK